MSVAEMKKNKMMNHLLGTLDRGEDIGHHGRLVVATVARHFISEEDDYNPPRRERIVEWQKQQNFPICPDPDDPEACNVYKDLKFPDHVYQHIQEFYAQKR